MGSQRARPAVASADAIVVLHVSLMFACIVGLAGRDVGVSDFVAAVIIMVILLVALATVGHIISLRRRPYDAWLTLDVWA